MDESGTDISAYYPLDSCAPWQWPDARGSLLTVTADADGTATASLSNAEGWNRGAILAAFDTSFAKANCITSDQSLAATPSISWSVTAGHTYVILVWGCFDTCTIGPDQFYGSYTLTYDGVRTGTGIGPEPIPDWVQAYGRASADATCEDGWNASWQEWAQDVTGGWVCTRNVPQFG